MKVNDALIDMTTAWVKSNGYESVEDWARDSDYTETGDVWIDEQGYLVNIYSQAFNVMEEMTSPPAFYEKLVELVEKILPEASFGTDSDGQLLIYTNLYKSGDLVLKMED